MNEDTTSDELNAVPFVTFNNNSPEPIFSITSQGRIIYKGMDITGNRELMANAMCDLAEWFRVMNTRPVPVMEDTNGRNTDI